MFFSNCSLHQEHDIDFKDQGIMVLGCGPYHIGESNLFFKNRFITKGVSTYFKQLNSSIYHSCGGYTI